jgi:hypothetical protein
MYPWIITDITLAMMQTPRWETCFHHHKFSPSNDQINTALYFSIREAGSQKSFDRHATSLIWIRPASSLFIQIYIYIYGCMNHTHIYNIIIYIHIWNTKTTERNQHYYGCIIRVPPVFICLMLSAQGDEPWCMLSVPKRPVFGAIGSQKSSYSNVVSSELWPPDLTRNIISWTGKSFLFNEKPPVCSQGVAYQIH